MIDPLDFEEKFILRVVFQPPVDYPIDGFVITMERDFIARDVKGELRHRGRQFVWDAL